MDWETIVKLIGAADDLVASGKRIHEHLKGVTGMSVEEIRAKRDALSNETKAIVDKGRQKLNRQ